MIRYRGASEGLRGSEPDAARAAAGPSLERGGVCLHSPSCCEATARSWLNAMWLSRGAKRRAVDNADHWQPTIHVNSSSFRVGRRALGLQKDGLPMLLLRSTYLAVEAGNLMLGLSPGLCAHSTGAASVYPGFSPSDLRIPTKSGTGRTISGDDY
jgi:hypothetical protein